MVTWTKAKGTPIYEEWGFWSYPTKSFQFSSVALSCLTLCDPLDCSTPDFSVHHQLPELTKTHVHWVGDAIQPSHPLSSPSLPAFNLAQHQGLFQSVSSSNQVAKALEFQLQHQSFGIQLSLWSNSHPYMTIGKTIALTRWIFVGKIMSLLFNMLSRFVIVFFQGASVF